MRRAFITRPINIRGHGFRWCHFDPYAAASGYKAQPSCITLSLFLLVRRRDYRVLGFSFVHVGLFRLQQHLKNSLGRNGC